mmetsp:Transcript_112969/g.364729  ORF Transcript_112969/g.364729 Transcript_112969/m.364729 type:complete len:206 (-) Transcript_112969:543-1160(-)
MARSSLAFIGPPLKLFSGRPVLMCMPSVALLVGDVCEPLWMPPRGAQSAGGSELVHGSHSCKVPMRKTGSFAPGGSGSLNSAASRGPSLTSRPGAALLASCTSAACRSCRLACSLGLPSLLTMPPRPETRPSGPSIMYASSSFGFSPERCSCAVVNEDTVDGWRNFGPCLPLAFLLSCIATRSWSSTWAFATGSGGASLPPRASR